MTASEVLIALLIHLITPILGVFVYIKLVSKMRKEGIEVVPLVSLAIIFFNYGGIVLILLTSIFWYWSGMASLGLFYLLLVAPITMIIIAAKYYRKRKMSTYFKWIFRSALLYIIAIPITSILTMLYFKP